MPNFFYFNATGQKFGPVNDVQLKSLATQGAIHPQTLLETDTGHRGQASQIPGLFAVPAQSVTMQNNALAKLVIDRPSTVYGLGIGYDVIVNGQNLGRITNGQMDTEFSVPAGMVKLEIKSLKPVGMRMITPAVMDFVPGEKKKVILRMRKEFYWITLIFMFYPYFVPPYIIEEGV